jgi:hypothetical protein
MKKRLIEGKKLLELDEKTVRPELKTQASGSKNDRLLRRHDHL